MTGGIVGILFGIITSAIYDVLKPRVVNRWKDRRHKKAVQKADYGPSRNNDGPAFVGRNVIRREEDRKS